MTDAALPTDIYATPIGGVKLARLAMEQDRVALRPAFYRTTDAAYGARAEAWCPLQDHPAPQAECSCGFYAVADERDLWRLGLHEPDLAVVDVELAGRVIEHAHGYRASMQIARSVSFHGRCARCGRPAQTLHRRHGGGLVPACARHARRPVSLADASASLGVPVRFDVGAPTVARRRRCAFVGAQLVVPILLLLGAGAVAVATRSGIPVTFGQLAIIAWLMSGAWALRPVARRLELPPTEAVRLQRRWSPLVAAVTIACDFVLTVGVVALWGALGG